jgi:hypothetical protein
MSGKSKERPDMGATKRALEEHDSKIAVATGIAIRAGVLETCPIHEDVVYETGDDIVDAHKLGNYLVTKQEVTVFDSRREMTDYIKQVVEECCNDECSYCARD